MRLLAFLCLAAICFSCERGKAYIEKDKIYSLYLSDLKSEVKDKYNSYKDSFRYSIEFEDNKKEVQYLLDKLEKVYHHGMKADSLLESSTSKEEALKCIEDFIPVAKYDANIADRYTESLLKLYKKKYIDSVIEYRIVFLRYLKEAIDNIPYLVGTCAGLPLTAKGIN